MLLIVLILNVQLLVRLLDALLTLAERAILLSKRVNAPQIITSEQFYPRGAIVGWVRIRDIVSVVCINERHLEPVDEEVLENFHHGFDEFVKEMVIVREAS